VLDNESSPAWFGWVPGKVLLATVWIDWVNIQVCDQFGHALDAMYAGCCVQEVAGIGGTKHDINQLLQQDGTYLDPVFYLEPSAIVDKGSSAADNWPEQPTLEMQSSGCDGQPIPVFVCGHSIGSTRRKVCHKVSNCVWVVCPNGEIF
jgi:hypothetical protein